MSESNNEAISESLSTKKTAQTVEKPKDVETLEKKKTVKKKTVEKKPVEKKTKEQTTEEGTVLEATTQKWK